MAILRHYVMNAAEGRDKALEAALRDLADKVRPLPGCEGVALLRDVDNARRLVFIETWADIEAHKTAGALIGREAFAPVMAALDGPPEGAYLDCLKTV